MDNSNLMLLCNTLNSECEIRKNPDYRANIDMVTVKVEQADGSQSNKTDVGQSSSPAVSEATTPVDTTSLLNQNNNMHSGPGYDMGMFAASSGAGDNLQKYPKISQDECVNDRKCSEIHSVQSSGENTTQDAAACGGSSSFDTNLSYNDPSCFSTTPTITNPENNLAKAAEGSSSDSQQILNANSGIENDSISCSNGNPFLQAEKLYQEQEVKPLMDSNSYQVYQGGHVSGQPDMAVHPGMVSSMESIGQPFLEPGFQNSQACSQSQSLTDLCWAQSGQGDQVFRCPVPNSAPVGGRMTTGQFQNGSSGFVQSYIPHGYQTVATSADPNSWHGQDKDQLQWVTNMMSMPQGQNPTQNLYDRNWNDLNDGSQSYLYSTAATPSIPLDMSLNTDQPIQRAGELTAPQHRHAFIPEPLGETGRETIKRSRSASSLDTSHGGNGGNVDPPKAKIPKDDSEKTTENYEISTNVHQLKPRHIVSWYIDHLVRENEEITDISKSNTWRDVNIYQSKDMYFMEPLLKKSGFPSAKFLSWMHGNFPNINIHAIDFTEGRQSNFLTDYEEQLSRKTRNEIITDTFLYFQEKKAIKMDASLV